MHDTEIITVVNDKISIAEPEHGQRFGTDALLLAAFAAKMPGVRAAELGTGSGIVAMLCAGREKFGVIDAVEVQPELAELCSRNIARNGMDNTVNAVCADAREFSRRGENAGAYGCVLFNPPYMKTDSGFRPADDGRFAARHEVFGDIGELCLAVAKLLKWGGTFLSVYRPDRLCDLICAMRGAALEPKKMLFVCDEIGKAPCLVLTEARLGAKPSLTVPPNLILRNDRQPTPEFRHILDTGEFL